MRLGEKGGGGGLAVGHTKFSRIMTSGYIAILSSALQREKKLGGLTYSKNNIPEPPMRR